MVSYLFQRRFRQVDSQRLPHRLNPLRLFPLDVDAINLYPANMQETGIQHDLIHRRLRLWAEGQRCAPRDELCVPVDGPFEGGVGVAYLVVV